jgi:hypothetical protein
MIRWLIGFLLLSAASIPAALAQGALPTAPNQAGPAANSPVLPPVRTAEDCGNGYSVLRDDAAKVGVMIKAASDRHAPSGEFCELIDNYRQALMKVMGYIEANSARCRLPTSALDQLRVNDRSAERLQIRCCAQKPVPDDQRPFKVSF